MPGRRFYKKYYKRKYKKKTLQKSNIFRKKSAKSQASQIYALNKKINRIYKQTAPEILVYSTNELSGFNLSFIGANTNNNNGFFQQNGVISRLFNSSGHFSGGTTNAPFSFTGQLLRVKNITLNIHVARILKSTVLAGTTVPAFANKTIGSYEKVPIMRITILRLSNSVNDVRSMNYIHRLYRNEDAPTAHIWDTEDTVFGPLNDTITTMGKVVYDRKFRMGSYSSSIGFKNVKINLKGGTYRRPEHFTANTIMGKDYVMCITVGCTGVGQGDTSFFGPDDILELTTSCKIAYVDDKPGYVEAARSIELKKGPSDFFGIEEGKPLKEEVETEEANN